MICEILEKEAGKDEENLITDDLQKTPRSVIDSSPRSDNEQT